MLGGGSAAGAKAGGKAKSGAAGEDASGLASGSAAEGASGGTSATPAQIAALRRDKTLNRLGNRTCHALTLSWREDSRG